MRGRLTQGKRDEADKERPRMTAVRGGAQRGGSVYGGKVAVPEVQRGKRAVTERKHRGKTVFGG